MSIGLTWRDADKARLSIRPFERSDRAILPWSGVHSHRESQSQLVGQKLNMHRDCLCDTPLTDRQHLTQIGQDDVPLRSESAGEFDRLQWATTQRAVWRR